MSLTGVVNFEGCFSSVERIFLDVSPMMKDRLRPGLVETVMNSAGRDTLLFSSRSSFKIIHLILSLYVEKNKFSQPI